MRVLGTNRVSRLDGRKGADGRASRVKAQQGHDPGAGPAVWKIVASQDNAHDTARHRKTEIKKRLTG